MRNGTRGSLSSGYIQVPDEKACGSSTKVRVQFNMRLPEIFFSRCLMRKTLLPFTLDDHSRPGLWVSTSPSLLRGRTNLDIIELGLNQITYTI